MSSLRALAVIGVMAWLACEPSAPPPPPPPAPAVAPRVAPTPAPVVAAKPTTCAVDADCNFAAGAQPARCVVGPAPAADKLPPNPDGSCVCLAGRCALRPNAARISPQACNRDLDDCAVDMSTARCEPGLASSDSPRWRAYGPSCACDRADQRCHLRWFDPVPCQTADDCWASDTPIAHAIRRPPRLRGRTFRGCVDGEAVPVCVEARCTLDPLRC